MISRRGLVAGAALAVPGFAAVGAEDPEGKLEALERRHGGRLGVAILETGRMRLTAHRGEERFPLCSTFKCLAAAFVLARVDRGEESLHRRIIYGRDYLVPYSPVAGQHAGGNGLTLGEVCEAAVTLSDNTAGNLMLDSFGGPAGLTGFLRSIGDDVTRLDRREPELNEAIPGDPRDTSSPVAIVETLRKAVLGNLLSATSRKQLAAWLVANKVGDKRLRAGVPHGWRVGDKTGTGRHNATNDIAVIWPNGRVPVVVAAYYVEADASEDERNAVLAEVGRLAASV